MSSHQPPTTFPVHPYITQVAARAEAEASNSTSPGLPTSSNPTKAAKHPSLIEKYNLRDRIADQTVASITSAISRSNKGKGREVDMPDRTTADQDDVQGKMTLQQRKERLILDSRRRMMEKLLRDKASCGKEDTSVDSEGSS
jgi:hypothetical protein